MNRTAASFAVSKAHGMDDPSKPKFPRATFRPASPANDQHAEYAVDWLSLNGETVSMLADLIAGAADERLIQTYLQSHPELLAFMLHGGHGRWVIPQKRLGAEFVSDFIIGEAASLGHQWHLIELESPTKKPFNKSGDPSSILTHAIRQIQDWRAWLRVNQNYASRSRIEGGLGLTHIDARVHGIVIIGRRQGMDWNDSLRRQIASENDIDVRSYDWLIQSLVGQLPFDRWDSSSPMYGKHMDDARWEESYRRRGLKYRSSGPSIPKEWLKGPPVRIWLEDAEPET